MSKLTADAGVSALVSARVYPNQAPQGATFPYIAYHQASRVSVKTFSGPRKLNKYSMVLECWGQSYSSAKAVAGAVCDALDGLAATIGSGPSIAVLGTFQQDEEDDFSEPVHGEERGPDVVRVQVDLWYRAP